MVPRRSPLKRSREQSVVDAEDRVQIYHFVLPIVALLGFSIWYGLDVQIGVIMSVAVTIICIRSTETDGLDADVRCCS